METQSSLMVNEQSGKLITIKLQKNLSQFRDVIRIVSNLNTEIVLTFDENGIMTKVIHASNVCMLDIMLNKNFFDEYNIVKEITYTFDSKTFSMALERMARDKLFLETTPNGLRMFNDVDDYTLNFFVSRKDERPMPENVTTCRWKITPGNFFNTIGELVEFTALGIFHGSNELNLKLNCNMIKGETKLKGEKIMSNNESGYYDMGYFIYVSSLRNLFDSMMFEYGHEKTAFLHGENELAKFSFVLASRIADDEVSNDEQIPNDTSKVENTNE